MWALFHIRLRYFSILTLPKTPIPKYPSKTNRSDKFGEPFAPYYLL